MPTSVLILTLNEEANLGTCLDSVSWCDDVVVLDSFSSDQTVQVAQSRGVRVLQRQFDDYASQRNFGLKEVAYKYPWVLMLDADERVPEDLCREIHKALASVPDATTLCFVRRKDYLFGRWIKRSSGYPTWFGRLARLGRVWVERPVNEEYHTDGQVAHLDAHIDHFPFNKGFSAWVIKHDRYSSMEAAVFVQQPPRLPRLKELLNFDSASRRRATKQLLYSFPARPVLVFAGLYLLRGGILDGRAGLTFSLLRAWYEYMIDCKIRENRRRSANLPV
jgi:glycosyltransferase involved in cell wall biosynthesis